MPEWKVDYRWLNRAVAARMGLQELNGDQRLDVKLFVANSGRRVDGVSGKMVVDREDLRLAFKRVDLMVGTVLKRLGEGRNSSLQPDNLELRLNVLEALNSVIGTDDETRKAFGTALRELWEAHGRLRKLQGRLQAPVPIAATLAGPPTAVIARVRGAIIGGGNGGSDGAGARQPVAREYGPFDPFDDTRPLEPVLVASAQAMDGVVVPVTVPGSGAPLPSPPPPAGTPSPADGASVQRATPAVSPLLDPSAIAGRLDPTGRAENFPNWRDLVDIEATPDGKVIYTAKSHRPGERGELSWKRFLRFSFGDTRRAVSAALGALRAGDEAGFDRMTAIWGAQMLQEYGLRVEVEGLEKLDPQKVYIFAPTHASQAEYAVLFLVLNGFSVGFMAKKEFRTNPFIRALFGRAMEGDRFFIVDRGDKAKAVETTRRMAERLSAGDNHFSVVMYPQGTRGRGRTDLRTGERMDPDIFARGPLKSGIGYATMDTVAAGRPVEVVPITIEGIGKVQPRGPHRVLANQTVRVRIGDPIDPTQYADLPKEEAGARVAGDIEGFYRKNYDAPLTPPRAHRYWARYGEAFLYLDTGQEELFNRWCHRHKADPAQVRAIRERIPPKELELVYREFRVRRDHGLRKLGTMPLPSDMYTRAERKKFGRAYRGAKLRMAASALRQVGPFTEGVFDMSGKAGALKKTAKAVGGALRAVGAQAPYDFQSPPARQEIPESARLAPLSPQQVHDAISRAIAPALERTMRGQAVELPQALRERITFAYGADPAIEADFTEYAERYLGFVAEDAKRFLDLQDQDTETNRTEMDSAYNRAIDAFEAVRRNDGSPMEEHVFAAIRDVREADAVLRPRNPATLPAFESLTSAWRALDMLTTRSSADRRSEAEYQADLNFARERVVKAYEEYATVARLAASHETFSFLPQNGRAIQPHDLKHALSARDVPQQIREELLAGHANLLGGNEPERDLAFAESMREFLDNPQYGRSLQAQLLRIHSVRDALLHNPTTFMWKMFVNAFGERGGNISDRLLAYREAMRHYNFLRNVNGNGRLDLLPRNVAMAIERARQKVIETAWDFLQSDDGMLLIEHTAGYLENYLQVPDRRGAGLAEALQANAEYWAARRKWAVAERQRNEALLPKIIDYARWREEQLGNFFIEEARLILGSAEQMMAQARKKVAGNRELEKAIAEYEGSYLAALASLSRRPSEKVPPAFTALQEQLQRQLENLDRLADPALREGRQMEDSDGHSVFYNRAMEAVIVGAAQAWNAASCALSIADMEPAHAVRRLFSLQSAAVHDKLTPRREMADHKTDGANLARYMGEGVLPAVARGLWAVRNGLPADHVDTAIREWARWSSEDFHRVLVADSRPSRRLPGTASLRDDSHDTGWYGDYSTAQYLSRRQLSTLIAKGNLDGTMPEPMGSGVLLVARMLPEGVGQPAADAIIIGALLDGHDLRLPAGRLSRVGSHDGTLWGGMTMTVATDPDISLLGGHPDLANGETTGRELRGVGRGASVVRGAAAVRGSMAGVPFMEVLGKRYGAETGPKPDGYVRIQPRKVEVNVEQLDPLALPGGPMGEGAPTAWQLRQSAEMMVWLKRREMAATAQARGLLRPKRGGTLPPVETGGKQVIGRGSHAGSPRVLQGVSPVRGLRQQAPVLRRTEVLWKNGSVFDNTPSVLQVDVPPVVARPVARAGAERTRPRPRPVNRREEPVVAGRQRRPGLLPVPVAPATLVRPPAMPFPAGVPAFVP